MDPHQKIKQAVSILNSENNASHISDRKHHSKSILDVHNDYIFVWNEFDSTVVAISLRPHEFEKVHLVPTDTPFFQVEQLLISPSGKWIFISGKKGAIVMEMPRRAGKHGRFLANSNTKVSDEYREIVCRVIPILDRLFSKHAKLVLHQASWHPGSIYEGHIVLLTSDNTLRILNINCSPSSSGALGPGQNPDQSIPLSSSLMNNSKPISTGLGVKESLGETAIGFTYGPPLGKLNQFQRRRHLSGDTYNEWDDDKENEESQGPIYWPIFCLYGNGNVYCFLTGLGDNAIYQPDIIGPLPMFPQAEDNYEGDSNGSYRAILRLAPAHPAAPPILVMATNHTVYHAIILNNHQNQNEGSNDDSDTESCTGSDWSSSVFGRVRNNKREPPNLSLHVFESLDINPTGEQTNIKDNLSVQNKGYQDTTIILRPDSSTPSRYFCHHSSGVHAVTLPMVGQLKEIAKDEFEAQSLGITNLSEEDSSLEHLLATNPGQSNVRNTSSIIGISLIPYPSPARFFCLMNNYSVEVLSLSIPYYEVATNLLTEESNDTLGKSCASKHKEVAFDKHIAKMLQKTVTQPVLKAGVNDLSGKDCHEILVQSTTILRQEYLAKLETVKAEIERHVSTLQSRKNAQQSAINRLQREKRGLMETATKLSETFDDLNVNNQKLSLRLDKALLKIQQQLPVRSDAELRMQRELQVVERKVKDLNNAMEQLRTKEKYQVRQIKQGEETSKGEETSYSPSNRASLLGENKLSSIKQVLQTNSKDIQQIVKDVNEVKRTLGM